MPILRSKIRAPELPAHVIARPRLLDRIATGDERLVVLEAPAGYGKSVLAAQVWARAPRATAWLHVDPDEADPRRFAQYITASLAEVLPAMRRTELAGEAESPDFDIASWTDDLVLFLQEVAKSRHRLILDNFESISDDDAPRVWLERMIDAAPATLSLLIATRRPVPLKLQRLIESGRAILVRQEQLALDLDEYREAIAARGLASAETDVEQQWERSQGWCVMLGLSADGTAGGAYVDEEVLPGLPADLREFLTTTSPFDVVTKDAVSAFGISHEALAGFVNQMSVHGTPHLLLEDGGALRVHPVLRERLVQDLYRTEEGRARASDAARYYSRLGQFEQARRVLMEAGRGEDVLAMLDDNWEAIDRLSMHSRARQWLEQLTAEFNRHPKYASTLTRLLRMAGQPRKLHDYLKELRASGEPIETWKEYPQLWAGEAWARTQLEGGTTYDDLAAEWEQFRDGARPADVISAEHLLAIRAVYELRFEQARKHVGAVLDFLSEDSFAPWANEQNLMAVALEESGRWREAVALREETIARCAREGDTIHVEINVAGLGWAFKELGRYDEALRSVDRTLEIGARMGGTRPLILPHLTRTRGEVLWHIGQRKEGLAELLDSLEGFRDVNRLEYIGTAVTIDHWKTCSGEPSDLIVEEDLKGFEVSEPHVRYLIRKARQAIDAGQYSDAGERLDRAQSLSADMLGWQVTVNMHQGLRHSREGDVASAHEALRTALRKLESIGASVYAMADPWLTAWAVVEATAAAIEPARTAALARGAIAVELGEAFRRRLMDASTTTDEATLLMEAALRWRTRGLDEAVQQSKVVPADLRTAYLDMLDHAPLPELRVHMLGPLSVSAAGRDVRFTRKASRGVLEMLLLEYPRPVHEERLLEAMWPEVDPASSKRSLQTAVNDLRKSLDPFQRPNGPSYVRFRDEHYVLELPDKSFVDYHTFKEDLSERISRVVPGASAQERDALQRILDLHRGELLEDAPYAEHVIEHREQARSLFLEGIVALARAATSTNPVVAGRLLERGLKTDPYWAEGLAMLMESLRQQDRVLAALRLYRQYEQRLEKDLGAEPDPQLREVFEGLTRG